MARIPQIGRKKRSPFPSIPPSGRSTRRVIEMTKGNRRIRGMDPETRPTWSGRAKRKNATTRPRDKRIPPLDKSSHWRKIERRQRVPCRGRVA